jgi:hypothetical protein
MSPPIRRTKGLPSRLPPGTRTLDTRCNKRAPPRQAPSSWSQREVFNLLCNPTRDDNLLSARPGHATGWLGLLAVFDADFSRRTARHNTPRCRLNGSGASGTMPAAEKGELVHKGTGHSRRHTATSTGGAAACAMATSAGCIFFSPHSPSLTQAKMRRKAAVPWSLAAFGGSRRASPRARHARNMQSNFAYQDASRPGPRMETGCFLGDLFFDGSSGCSTAEQRRQLPTMSCRKHTTPHWLESKRRLLFFPDTLSAAIFCNPNHPTMSPSL